MGMSVTISAATAQDVEQIFRLQYLCFQSEAELYGNYRIDPLVQSLDSVREEVGTDLVFVARLGDEVVGSVRGFTDADGTGRIGKLCVHPRLRNHGLGTRLLRAAEAGLTDGRSATRFRLHTGERSEEICGSTGRPATPGWATPPEVTGSAWSCWRRTPTRLRTRPAPEPRRRRPESGVTRAARPDHPGRRARDAARSSR